MKKIYFILALIAIPAAAAFAQAELRHTSDTLEINSNGRDVVTITNKGNNSLCIDVGGFVLDIEGHGKNAVQTRNSFTAGGFRFGFIGLTKPDYSMYDQGMMRFMELDNGRSISVSFDIVLNLALSKTSDLTWISFGLRPRWNNYVFNDRITLERIGGMVYPVALDDMSRLKKSKLTTFSLDFPIMFEVNPAKRFSIEGGVYGGLTLRSHTKVKFPKNKDKGDFGVNFFNAGVTLRVKYSWVGIFADYSLTPLFKSDAGPRTNPFIIGITF